MNSLSLEIISPENGAVLAESPVNVRGTVSDAGAIIVVNTVEVRAAADGSFSVQVKLSAGENIIPVAATTGGLRTENKVTVIYAPPGL